MFYRVQWGACDEAVMWLVHVRRGECWLAVLTLGRHHLLFWCLAQHFSACTEESTEFSRFLLRKTFFQNIDMDNSLLPFIVWTNNFLDKTYNSHLVVRVECLHEREHLWLFRDFLISFLFPYICCEWKIDINSLTSFSIKPMKRQKTLKNTF